MLKSFTKTNSASLAWMVTGSFWMAIGTLYGLTTAVHLMAPEFFDNIFYFVFGRTRPSHVNTVIFGFLVPMGIGAALYYVPALLKTKLWSESLAWLALLFWNAAVVSGPSTFSFGITQGREYTEYVFWADCCVMATLVLLLVDVVMTIATRKENSLYVSVWYVVGTVLWTAGVYPLGNVMWHPETGSLPGVLDSIFLWYYGHNLVGLLLTPIAVAAAYFVIPRITQTPLYSHTLSLVGFFALVALYTHIGGHHLIQAPSSNWLKTISIIDSIGMFIPVSIVLANLWLTARGRAGRLWSDPAGRFVITGTVWYFLTCIQGPLQSLPSVQQVTHFTNWTIGHAHIAVLGFAGFTALGAMYHVLPNVTGRKLWSTKLVSLQYGLLLIGLVGFFLVLTTAGLVQGHAWAAGQTVYKILPQIAPYMVLRMLLGLFIIAAAFVGLFNVIMTIRRGEKLAPATEGAKQ